MSSDQQSGHNRVTLSDPAHLPDHGQPSQTIDKLLSLVARNAPVVFFMIDRGGIIRHSIGKAAESLDQIYPDRVEKSVHEVYRKYPQVVHNFQRALMGESFSDIEILDSLVFDTRYTPLTDSDGSIIGVIGVSVDITDQRKAEEALARTEALFRVVFEKAGIGILLLNPQGRMLGSNPAFQKMVGYTHFELEQMSYTDLHHPEDRTRGQDLFAELLSGQRELFTLEQHFRCKDGRDAWAHVIASRMAGEGEETQFIIAMLEDITERNQIEQELAEMRRRLMQSRENERLHLAQELHDSPLQDIIGLSFQVQNMLQNVEDKDFAQDLQRMQITLEQLAVKMRTIASELRPPTLAPFGLFMAIQSHSENFNRLHPHLRITLQLDRDDRLLPEEIRLALFRIYQESLNNILRHAQADQVWIRLKLENDQVLLEIQDNGKGFELPSRWIQLAREGHLGLVGARERAEAIGGRFEVRSSPGQGALIRAIVPCKTSSET